MDGFFRILEKRLSELICTRLYHISNIFQCYIEFSVIQCQFVQYGGNGELQEHDNLCFVPINYISKKIFVFLWFWIETLSIVTALDLVYGFVLAVSHCGSNLNLFLTCGNWLYLHLLSKNLDVVMFKQLKNELRQPNLQEVVTNSRYIYTLYRVGVRGKGQKNFKQKESSNHHKM